MNDTTWSEARTKAPQAAADRPLECDCPRCLEADSQASRAGAQAYGPWDGFDPVLSRSNEAG